MSPKVEKARKDFGPRERQTPLWLTIYNGGLVEPPIDDCPTRIVLSHGVSRHRMSLPSSAGRKFALCRVRRRRRAVHGLTVERSLPLGLKAALGTAQSGTGQHAGKPKREARTQWLRSGPRRAILRGKL